MWNKTAATPAAFLVYEMVTSPPAEVPRASQLQCEPLGRFLISEEIGRMAAGDRPVHTQGQRTHWGLNDEGF
jgi:hypothetical protein